MKLKEFSAAALALALTACSGGGGGGGGGGTVVVDPLTAGEEFVENINYDDPIASYFLAKEPTLEQGVIIVEEDDGSTWGIDIEDSTRFDLYDYDLDYYLDFSFEVWGIGGNLYEDIYGNLYEKSTEVSKDLEKVGAVLHKARIKGIGEQIAANYGLSESRGFEVANLLVEWKELKKRRALTDHDADLFAKELTGTSLSEMAKAYKSYTAGQSADLDQVIEKAASQNGTTPEHVRDLFSVLLKN